MVLPSPQGLSAMSSPFVQSPEQARDYCSDGRCLKVGVLTNPRSGGNRKGGNKVHKFLNHWPEVIHREVSDPQGVSEALSDFSRNEIELIVVNGGDGTVQAVLTVLGNKKIFIQPPLLALLRSGTTSMLPRDVGVEGRPATALRRILEWSKATNENLVIQSRSILRVQRDTEVLFGMFFGAGAICEGIRLFHSKDNPMGWRGQLMPMLTMARLLLAILFNNQDKITPFLNSTGLNGRRPEKRADLLVLISTLDRLFLGMRPYWGTEEGPLRYTAVGTNPKKLLRILFALFCSGNNQQAIPANGYSSHNVTEVRLDMQGDFTLDGELYAAGDGPVTVSSAGQALFLCSC